MPEKTKAIVATKPTLKRSLPQASEEEVQGIERGYWKEKWHAMKKDYRLYFLLIPLFFFLVAWKYLPIASMIVSFKYFKNDATFGGGTFSSNFVGFYWFKVLFNMPSFWVAFRNSFMLSFYGLVFGFPFPIILALFFSEIRTKWYRATLQVLTYFPKFISVVVMTSLLGLLLRIVPGDSTLGSGPIGSIFQHMGVSDLLSNPRAFRSIFTVSGIWTDGGYGSIVYFAAILGISPTNYEAARIDGANKMQQLRYVTIPGMAPTLVIMLILKMGNLLSVGYEKVILLQELGTGSSTYETSQIISTFVINNVLNQGLLNDGAGSAADMFNSLLSMVLVIGSNKVAKKVSSTSLF
jgi:putative aldouronate transport system permease protein